MSSAHAFDFFDGTPSPEDFVRALQQGAPCDLIPLAGLDACSGSGGIHGLIAAVHPQMIRWDSEVRRMWHCHERGELPPWTAFIEGLVQTWFTKTSRSRLYHVQTSSKWHLFLAAPPSDALTVASCQFGYYERIAGSSEIDFRYHLEGAS